MSGSPYNDATALTDYVIWNYANLMTPSERRAHLHLMTQAKHRNSSAKDKQRWAQHYLRLHGPLPGEALILLADGPGVFFERIRDRILAEHMDEIVLNRCEKCGCLCRTPKACLCPVCNHNWYERRKE